MTRPRSQLLAALTVAALLAGACSSGSDGAEAPTEAPTAVEQVVEPTATPMPPPTPEPTPTPMPPTPTPADGEQVDDLEVELARLYVDAFALFYEVLGPPVPDDPRIDELYEGESRQTLVDLAAQLAANGEVARLPEGSQATATFELVGRPADDVVFGVGCIVDDGFIEDAATGERRVEALSTSIYDVTFRLTDGRWRLATETQTEYRQGVAECE